MIMPCMNATSAGESLGKVGRVDGGSVLLGCPGAPGCTTTGGDADPACWADAGSVSKPSRATAAMTKGSIKEVTILVRQVGFRCGHIEGDTQTRTVPNLDESTLDDGVR